MANKIKEMIVSSYEDMLIKESSLRVTRTKFQAHKAGRCHKLHKFYTLLDKVKPLLTEEELHLPGKSLMRLRLGELVHKDIQKAISNIPGYITINEAAFENETVSGHIDSLIFRIANSRIVDSHLIDIKTINNYHYTKLFGRKNNRDPIGHVNYKMQVGTYLWLLPIKVDSATLIYVNIDNTRIKEVEVEYSYKDIAIEYWKELTISCKRKLSDMIKGEKNIPVHPWECQRCQFLRLCENNKLLEDINASES